MAALYTIVNKNLDKTQHKLDANVELNIDHDIFKGHFPSQPVLPGVCQLQMVEQLLSAETGMMLKLDAASNIKYLKMVDPHTDKLLNFSIDFQEVETGLKVTALLKSQEEVCMKAKLNFKIL